MATHLLCTVSTELFDGPSFCSIEIDSAMIDEFRKARDLCRTNDWAYVGLNNGVYYYDARVPVQDGDTIIFATPEAQTAWEEAEEMSTDVVLGDGEDATETRIPTTRVEVNSSGSICLLGWEKHTGKSVDGNDALELDDLAGRLAA